MRDPLPLWPSGPDGVPPAPRHEAPADHPRLVEIPALVPFLLPGAAPRPAVVVCPGGGYGNRASHEGEPIARWLNGIGLHAFVLHYRVWPWRNPAPLMDAQRAIRLVRAGSAGFGVDPARIGILGFSAGGHLAACAATLHDLDLPHPIDDLAGVSPRPDALVACYAVISFGENSHSGSLRALLGDHPDPFQRRLLSLEHAVSERTPPTFIWHTSDDPSVPVENALLFAGALRRQRVPFALHVYPTGHHGLGLADQLPAVARWTTACADWFADLGWR